MSKLKDESFTPLCSMPERKTYKCLQTPPRGTPYLGPNHGVKPINRLLTPHNLGNLKNACGKDSDEGHFMNQNLEVVEEQMYSSNIIPDAEISTETVMSYEEWLAAQGLVGLKSGFIEDKMQQEMSQHRKKHPQDIHWTLDAMIDFLRRII